MFSFWVIVLLDVVRQQKVSQYATSEGMNSVVQGLREITQEDGALLCFDEVMTGFRCSTPHKSSRSRSFLNTRMHHRSVLPCRAA